jgi:putative transposase
MDGKGRWRDNVFIERLWNNIKYEDIYLKAYGSLTEVKKGLTGYFTFYKQKRWHHIRIKKRKPLRNKGAFRVSRD